MFLSKQSAAVLCAAAWGGARCPSVCVAFAASICRSLVSALVPSGLSEVVFKARPSFSLRLVVSSQLLHSLFGGCSSSRSGDAVLQCRNHRGQHLLRGGSFESPELIRWDVTKSSLNIVVEGGRSFGSSSFDLLRKGEGLVSSASAVESVDLPLHVPRRLAVEGLVGVDPDPVAITKCNAVGSEGRKFFRLGLEGVAIGLVQLQVFDLHACRG